MRLLDNLLHAPALRPQTGCTRAAAAHIEQDPDFEPFAGLGAAVAHRDVPPTSPYFA